MTMKVSEIEDGKKACVLVDCGQAHLYYPKAGKEEYGNSECNVMRLDFEDEDEANAVFEAASYLDIPESEIEVAYG